MSQSYFDYEEAPVGNLDNSSVCCTQTICPTQVGGECSESTMLEELCGQGGPSCKDFCASFGCVYDKF